MILNNLKYFCKGVFLNANPRVEGAEQKDINGTTLRADTIIENCILDGRLQVGTGITSVTVDDYKLAKKVDFSLLDVVAEDTVSKIIDNRFTKTFVKTLTYKGTETINITEIGLYKNIKWSTTGQQVITDYLLARQLLSAPITVKPNETFTVSMRIEI